MSRTLVLIGTRKGCFVLESDADRRDWSLRGPFCESWPMYHAVYDQGSGTIFAAAASEWHGSAIWRSSDLGETWEHSSEGLAYEDGRRFSKVSTLAAGHDRLLVGVEAPGIFESRDGGATFSMLSTLAGEPGSEGWDDPANQPPGHLGISGIELHPDDPARFYAIVQGVGLWETTDGGNDWTPRNRGLRADGPETTVAGRPVAAAVGRLPEADARRSRRSATGRRDAARCRRCRDARAAGWRGRPTLAAGLAGEGGEHREGCSAVPALEDAGRLDADEQPVVAGGERRDLREAPAVLVGETLRGVLPGLAEIAAAPDGEPATHSPRRRRSCPTHGRRRRGTRASSHRTGRGGSSRDGRRRSRARSTPCGCRSGPACVTSPPVVDDCSRLMTTPRRFSHRSRSRSTATGRRRLRRSRSAPRHLRRPARARPRRGARWRAPAPARSGRGRPAAS